MDVLNILLANTYSLTKLKERVRIVKNYLLNQLFGGKFPISETDNAYLNSLPSDFLKQFNKDNFDRIFADLDKEISKLSPLILYLAFEAEDETVQKIGQRVREMFKGMTLLDIKYEPKLLGGAAISWKGIYKDYSLRVMIEAKKEEILQNFKKFLR